MPAPSSFTAGLAEGKPEDMLRLTEALKRNGGSKSAAARDLDLSYKTLWKIGERHAHVKKLLDRYGLEQSEAAGIASRAATEARLERLKSKPRQKPKPKAKAAAKPATRARRAASKKK